MVDCTLEIQLRKEDMVEQNEAVLEDVGNELATQELLGEEPWLGEKPPWGYMREEESYQLLLELGQGVGGGQFLQLVLQIH